MSEPEDRLRALQASIEAHEGELAGLRVRERDLEQEVEALREQLRDFEQMRPDVTAYASPQAPDRLDAYEKVALFRSLFRGRENIFPRLWVNSKTGKKGYAPACSNEWVRGVCDKPRTRCGECPSRSFVPVTDQVVLGHVPGTGLTHGSSSRRPSRSPRLGGWPPT